MKKLALVTKNTKKYKSISAILEKHGVQLTQASFETPEIQSREVEEVAEYSAEYAAEVLEHPAIKIDVGFSIASLNGFPGPYIKDINKWLTTEDILKVLEGKSREAKFIDVLAFAEPGSKITTFIAERKGTISAEARGENGWMIDRIFIPEGQTKTLAEMTDKERQRAWGNSYWGEFINYLFGLISK